MVAAADSLPTDLAAAHAMIIAQRDALMAAEARASAAESEAQYRALLIEKLKYTIRKLRHERFGQSSERRRPARRPLPEHLPRERIVYPAPSICPCCGGGTLRKIGEDVTETLSSSRASGK